MLNAVLLHSGLMREHDLQVMFTVGREQQRIHRRLAFTRFGDRHHVLGHRTRSEEHTSELQSLMRISYAVFCLIKKNDNTANPLSTNHNNRTHDITTYLA